jgi:hypothetical protein
MRKPRRGLGNGEEKNGFATVYRASDNVIVRNMVQDGLPLGGLWFSDYLDS